MVVLRDATRLLVMDQAIFENRIRNLLWLLRSAAPSCQVFGLDERSNAPTLREQPTVEMRVNGVSPVRETINFGAYAEAEG